MADHYQLNLGSLRSSITLTLHTHHAARIWQGRTAREGVHSIMGMAGYISVTNQIKQAAAQDDPYADWAIVQLEEKLMQAKDGMLELTQQLDRIRQELPTQIDMGDNLNIHPVTLPLYIGSQLGFLAVYLLTDYDTLVRHTLLALTPPWSVAGTWKPGSTTAPTCCAACSVRRSAIGMLASPVMTWRRTTLVLWRPRRSLDYPLWTSLRGIAAPSSRHPSFVGVLWQWMALTRWQRNQ